MSAIKQISFKHTQVNDELKDFLHDKLEDTIDHFLKKDDYSLKIVLENTHDGFYKRYSCDVTVFIFSRRLHLLVRKSGVTFYDVAGKTDNAMRNILSRILKKQHDAYRGRNHAHAVHAPHATMGGP